MWRDYVIETIENQYKFLVPLNRDTENIFYNQRLIVDGCVDSEPLAWRVTKVNRVSTPGINLITYAQDQFNEHTDAVFKDSDGNITEMYADYYSSNIKPEEYNPSDPVNTETRMYSTITYAGVKPEIKVGGSYKKFTVQFYNSNNEEIQLQTGSWNYKIRPDDKSQWGDASRLINVKTSIDSTDLNNNQVKIKFVGGDSYIGNTMLISYVSDSGIESSVEVEVLGL